MMTHDLACAQRILSRDGKILRRAEASHYVDAQQVLHEAKEEAARMIEAAQHEIERQYAQQRLAGYTEGIREGRQEQARLIVHAALTHDTYLANAEQSLCTLLIAAVRKIFADFDDSKKARIVVHQALSALRTQTQVSIRVHPSQYDTVKRDVLQFKTLFPNLEALEIVPDNTIGESACVMSSELGTVETSIDTQIDALAAAISQTARECSVANDRD